MSRVRADGKKVHHRRLAAPLLCTGVLVRCERRETRVRRPASMHVLPPQPCMARDEHTCFVFAELAEAANARLAAQHRRHVSAHPAPRLPKPYSARCAQPPRQLPAGSPAPPSQLRSALAFGRGQSAASCGAARRDARGLRSRRGRNATGTPRRPRIGRKAQLRQPPTLRNPCAVLLCFLACAEPDRPTRAACRPSSASSPSRPCRLAAPWPRVPPVRVVAPLLPPHAGSSAALGRAVPTAGLRAGPPHGRRAGPVSRAAGRRARPAALGSRNGLARADASRLRARLRRRARRQVRLRQDRRQGRQLRRCARALRPAPPALRAATSACISRRSCDSQ